MATRRAALKGRLEPVGACRGRWRGSARASGSRAAVRCAVVNVMAAFFKTYMMEIQGAGLEMEPYEELLMTLTTKVLENFKEPFVFEPLHKSVREPFDYYRSFSCPALSPAPRHVHCAELPHAPPRALRRTPAVRRRGVPRSRPQHGVRLR